MGLDLGLEQAGLKVVLACDVDPNCRATIAANRPQLPVLSDVWRYDAATLRELAQKLGPIDVMVGGPRAKPFPPRARARALLMPGAMCSCTTSSSDWT